jgi:CHAT domain-containing protein
VTVPALPGTEAAARALAPLLGSAPPYTGAKATEDVLRSAHGPRIVHVATHGFFLEDESGGPGGTRGLVLDSSATSKAGATKSTENPLLRSGLVFAGANRHVAARDGLLTALEASALDLYGTQLVVLSACETGVGKVENADGVYGLRRALVKAGAESEVMSLWKVDDEATRELMTGFYGRLMKGGGRSESLRQAQIELSRHPEHAHPYYWASFIASGDWRSLDGKDGPVVEAPSPAPQATPKPHACGCRMVGDGMSSFPAAGSLFVGLLGFTAMLRRSRARSLQSETN